MANIIQTFPKGNGTDLSIIAEEFDDIKDYKVGDKVIKDKKYYVFTSDHDAGAWDSSDVDETNVSDEIPIGLTDEDMDEIKTQFHPVRYGNVRNYQIYSPTEHVVGEWQKEIDGVLKKKPMYEKNITFTIPSNQNAYDLSILNVDKLISCEGWFQFGVYRLGLGQMYNSNNYTTVCQSTDGGNNLLWMNVSGYQGASAEATLQYTKTTDEWEEV